MHSFPTARQTVTRVPGLTALAVQAECACGFTAWELSSTDARARAALGRLIRAHLADTGLALPAVTAR